MKNVNFAIIAKIILIVIILSTPFRYAFKSHKNKQYANDIKTECVQIVKQIEVMQSEARDAYIQTEKMRASIEVMRPIAGKNHTK